MRPLPRQDAAVIPHSFELFYAATVMRTLAAALRVTTEREIAHRATQHAYAVVLSRWRDRQSRPMAENARYAMAVAVRTATELCRRQDGSAFRAVERERTPADDELGPHWFDIRDGLRALALNASASWPPRSDTLFSALVADGDAWLRDALTAWLTQLGAGTVHEAATVAEARARARASGPGELAIVDLGLSEDGGIELIEDLGGLGWQRIVVLAAPDRPYPVAQAFRAGAQACLLKPASPTGDYLRRVGPEGEPSGAPFLDIATSAFSPATASYDLSSREIEVLQLVAAGHSNREIGQTLNLSAATIKSHLSRIGRKLGAGDRVRMVVHAMRANIIR